LFYSHPCGNVIHKYVVQLTVQNTFHAKVETEVPSHVKVIIEPFAFLVYNLETESEVVAKY